MNPSSAASTFTVQKISAHHCLIRGDSSISEYMKFCGTKWSNTYGGWIINANDEIDLIQMHFEVLDSLSQTHKELSKEKSKKTKDTKRHSKVSKKSDTKKSAAKKSADKKVSKYTRMKRGEDISDDEEEDDDYIPSTEPSSEEDDDYIPSTEPSSEDEDEETEEEETDEEEEETDVEETDEDEEETDSDNDSSEDECETDNTRKKEYQCYKNEILAYGYMTEKQQGKFDAIWNKYLKGWLVPKSYLEKLQKYGWVDLYGEEEVKPKKEIKVVQTPVAEKKVVVHTPMVKKKVIEPKKDIKVVHTPMVKKKVIPEEPKTFENYKNMFLAKGKMTIVESTSIQAIFHPGLKAYLVFPEFEEQLVKLGFENITPSPKETFQDVKVVKISFAEGDKLDIKNVE